MSLEATEEIVKVSNCCDFGLGENLKKKTLFVHSQLGHPLKGRKQLKVNRGTATVIIDKQKKKQQTSRLNSSMTNDTNLSLLIVKA